MSRSVLRAADQVDGRYPEVCVLSGESSSPAVRLSAPEWKGRRGLLTIPGLVTAVAGAFNSNPQQIGFGMFVAAFGVSYLTFANNRFWVTCSFRPAASTIIVEPTHARFDAEARLLYLRSV